MSATATATRPAPVRTSGYTAYSAVIGLATLAVILQAVWAGVFIREGQDNNATWVAVHARGADVAIGLAAIATVIAFARLRHRRDLVVGSAVFTVLLVVEAYLGGLVGNSPAVEIAHFPIAMVLTALAVWLPFRARTGRTAPRDA